MKWFQVVAVGFVSKLVKKNIKPVSAKQTDYVIMNIDQDCDLPFLGLKETESNAAYFHEFQG